MANRIVVEPGYASGFLRAIRIAEVRKYPNGGSRNFWECLCDPDLGGCGKITHPIAASKLTSGHTKSCGCLKTQFVVNRNKQSNGRRLGKGWSKGILYPQWLQMVHKCINPNIGEYERYGGRGISVCQEWENSYPTYEAWALANGYKKGLTLDRRNNDGNYEPGNCRWATAQQQARNRRNNTRLTAFGETKTLVEWTEDNRCVVNYHTLSSRAQANKMTHEEMITKK